jgi:hypothetical protein
MPLFEQLFLDERFLLLSAFGYLINLELLFTHDLFVLKNTTKNEK